jgi:hypothetical protein
MPEQQQQLGLFQAAFGRLFLSRLRSCRYAEVD